MAIGGYFGIMWIKQKQGLGIRFRQWNKQKFYYVIADFSSMVTFGST